MFLVLGNLLLREATIVLLKFQGEIRYFDVTIELKILPGSIDNY